MKLNGYGGMRADISSMGCVSTAVLPCGGSPGAPDEGGAREATRGGMDKDRRTFLVTESVPIEDESEVRSIISGLLCVTATEISAGTGGGSFNVAFGLGSIGARAGDVTDVA